MKLEKFKYTQSKVDQRKRGMMIRYLVFFIIIFLFSSFVLAQVPYPGHPGIEVCDNNLCVKNGSVGIGTTTPNPLVNLDVVGILDADQGLIGTLYSDQICLAGDCKIAWPVGSSVWLQNGNNIYYDPVGTGFVGIETSVPGSELDVNGNIRIGLVANIQGWSLEKGDSAVATLRFDADRARFWAGNTGQEVMSLKENGYVGIGTASPNIDLHVQKTKATPVGLTLENLGTGGSEIQIIAQGAGTGDPKITLGGPSISQYVLGVDISDGSKFKISNNLGTNDYVTVDATGRVGIGTTIPQTKLYVAGTINATGDVCTDAGGGTCLSDGIDVSVVSGFPNKVCFPSSCVLASTGVGAGSVEVNCPAGQIPFNCGGDVSAGTGNIQRFSVIPFYNVAGNSGCHLDYDVTIASASVVVVASCVQYIP